MRGMLYAGVFGFCLGVAAVSTWPEVVHGVPYWRPWLGVALVLALGWLSYVRGRR